MIKQFFLIIVAFILSNSSFGQDGFKKIFNDQYDSTYYDKLDELLTAKVFLARKFSDFELNDHVHDKAINYKSNPSSSIGFGFSYKWLGVSLGIGLQNSNDSIFGQTNRIDLQTQINLRKLTINLYSGAYNGYYLQNSKELLSTGEVGEYYNRADIQNMTYGISGYYVFNSSRYSNRATFLQNEWQKKTGGSFLAGGNVFYNRIKGDSSLIPHHLIDENIFNGVKFNRTGYFALGGNIGYGGTLVLWNHWFFNLSMLVGLSSGITTIYPEGKKKESAFKIGATLLNSLGLGYNSNLFYAGLIYSNLQANSPLPLENTGVGFDVGQFKFMFAYRFKVPKHNNILPEWLPFEL